LERAKRLKGQTALSEPLKADPKSAYNDYINMYSKLLFKAGKDEEAYKYTTEAYKNIRNRDSELVENYAFLSGLHGKYEESLPVLAKAVKEGKYEKRYLDQVRKGYSTLNPGKDVDVYIANLQKEFITKIRTHVEKLMIDEAAPEFAVTDVNGEKVSLSDFKGKTIVLDFWATWCGPCVASFPAMQMAANRYASDPSVKFLFIHTWENTPDPLTDAKSFLSKRNYKFDLYMDPRNPSTKHSPAADAFGIDGIPAKFIIDGNGKIRFKVSGFEGKDEAAAEEVVQMIELARKDGHVEVKKKASVVLGGLSVGTKAPEFKADEWLSETPDMKGRFVALDFWGTHCKPCIAGFAHINELHRKFKDKIVFIATTEQARPGVPEDVYTFQGGAPIEFYSMLKKSFDAYNVQGIPYMVVVDPTGIVRFSGNGHDLDEQTLLDLFAKYGAN
jgi:thiol-disulfide isomerase/thioredoxin